MGGTKMGRMRILLWAALLTAVITGCTSTRYVGVPEYHHDTVYKARKDSIRYQTVTSIIDSIRIHDSTVVHTDATGKVTGTDTWHLRDRYHRQRDSTTYYRSLADSLMKAKSVIKYKPFPVKTTKTIYRMKWWQESLMWVGVAALIAITVYAGYRGRKLILPLLKKIIPYL
jgi:uncharacterized protein YuzE